jgi:hypothetical protein
MPDQKPMNDAYIKAYHEFRNSVDLTKTGILPDINNLVWYLLMGVPRVPADEEESQDASFLAIDQRVTILKAVFVEVNRHEGDAFLDEGLQRYDQATKAAKALLLESDGKKS